MVPAASAAPVAASRQPSCTARSAHADAPYGDMVSSSATCAAADRVTTGGQPSAPAAAFSSRAAARDVICATAASSRACAHDATRRHDPATAARSPSPRPAGRRGGQPRGQVRARRQPLSDPPRHRRQRHPPPIGAALRRSAGIQLREIIQDRLLRRLLLRRARNRGTSRSRGTGRRRGRVLRARGRSRSGLAGGRRSRGRRAAGGWPGEGPVAEDGAAEDGAAEDGAASGGPADCGPADGAPGSGGPAPVIAAISAPKSISYDHDRPCGAPAPSASPGSAGTGSPPPLSTWAGLCVANFP